MSVLKKSHNGAVLGKLEKSHKGAACLFWRKVIMVLIWERRRKVTKVQNTPPILFWEKCHNGAVAISNQHQYDVSPEQNGKKTGQNVIKVLTFFFFELYRGSRGLPLVFLDSFMYFPHFRISGVATYKPSLGPFFGSKEKKPLNLHISKSILAPIWLFSRTLQSVIHIESCM